MSTQIFGVSPGTFSDRSRGLMGIRKTEPATQDRKCPLSLLFSQKPIPQCHKMIAEAKRLSQLPEEHLLKDLRNLETKMGFVLTLVRSSTFPLVSCSDLLDVFGNSFKPPSGASSTNKVPLQMLAMM